MTKKKEQKLKQHELFEVLHEMEKPEAATELMMKVAEKVPVKKKIASDFSPAEQAKIFARIKASRHDEQVEAESDVVAMQKEQEKLDNKERRKKAREIKFKARQMEAGNKSRIILFPSFTRKKDKTEWYKLGNFSAIYYAYRIAERIGKPRPKIQKDNDGFYTMHAIISIADAEGFVKRVMKLKEFDRHEETVDGIRIIYMKKGLTDDELALLRNTEKQEKDMMHEVLKPKKGEPELFLTILMAGRQIGNIMNGLGNFKCRVVGDRLMGALYDLLAHYYYYAEGLEDTETAKQEMMKQVYLIRVSLELLGNGEIIPLAKACAIGQTMVKIEVLVKEIKAKK